jgi:glycolate oxidase FAD binding subunit
VTSLAGRLAETVVEIERAVAALVPDCLPSVTARATLGVLEAQVSCPDVGAARALVERLRAFVSEAEGSVVVERGTPELRAAVDPWGEIAPGPLALMQDLKDAFDPARVLNPGRFAGGL